MTGKKRDEIHDKWLFYKKKQKELEGFQSEVDKSGDPIAKVTVAISTQMFKELANLARLMLDD
jgi:hypothetical protein